MTPPVHYNEGGHPGEVIPEAVIATSPLPHDAPKGSLTVTEASLIRIILSPHEVWEKIVAAGASKAKYSWGKKILLAFLAGCYLSLGMAFCFCVGGQLTTISKTDPGLFNIIYGFFGLPFSLTIIVLLGGELFTSDAMYMSAAYFEGRVGGVTVFWNLFWAWIGNLCGTLFMVQMFIWGGIYTHREDWARSVSVKKVSFGFGIIFTRGIFGNWLVNIAVWQAISAQDVTGKFVGVFIPITIFAAIGFEHCVANMYGVSQGIRLYSGVTALEFLKYNLVPATMGNGIAPVIFLSGFYYICIGSGHAKMVSWWNGMCDNYMPSFLVDLLKTGDYEDQKTKAARLAIQSSAYVEIVKGNPLVAQPNNVLSAVHKRHSFAVNPTGDNNNNAVTVDMSSTENSSAMSSGNGGR